MEKDLIIYFIEGNTGRFHKIKNLMDIDNELSFKYYGISTETWRIAKFNKNNIAGYVVSTEE